MTDANQLRDKDGNVIDGAPLAAITDNIDGKQALVVAAALYGTYSDNYINPARVIIDGGDIPASIKTLIVINLNYVWDAANTKWVRMTQP